MDACRMDSGKEMIWNILMSLGVFLCAVQTPCYAEPDANYTKYGSRELANIESYATKPLPQSMLKTTQEAFSPLRDCYQETQLAIYQAGDAEKKIQLPVRVNLLNDWVSLRFQSAAKKTAGPKAAEVEQVQFSKLWRKPKDFIPTEKLAKRCLLEE